MYTCIKIMAITLLDNTKIISDDLKSKNILKLRR